MGGKQSRPKSKRSSTTNSNDINNDNNSNNDEVDDASMTDDVRRCSRCHATWNHLGHNIDSNNQSRSSFSSAPPLTPTPSPSTTPMSPSDDTGLPLVDCDITREFRRAPIFGERKRYGSTTKSKLRVPAPITIIDHDKQTTVIIDTQTNNDADTESKGSEHSKKDAENTTATGRARQAIRRRFIDQINQLSTKDEKKDDDDEGNSIVDNTDLTSNQQLLNLLNGYSPVTGRRYSPRDHHIFDFHAHLVDLLAKGADPNFTYRGATALAHAIVNEHQSNVIEALIRAGSRVTSVFPCSDHLTLAAGLNPSIAMQLIRAGATPSRSALISLMNIKIRIADDALLLQHIIEGGINPYTCDHYPSSSYCSTIPDYITECIYPIGTLVRARAPPGRLLPDSRIPDAWHPAVITDVSIGWCKNVCVRVHFLKFRGHYDEWIDHRSPRLQESKAPSNSLRTFEPLSEILIRRGNYMTETMIYATQTLTVRQELILVVSALTRSIPPIDAIGSSTIRSGVALNIPRALIDMMASYVSMVPSQTTVPFEGVRYNTAVD